MPIDLNDPRKRTIFMVVGAIVIALIFLGLGYWVTNNSCQGILAAKSKVTPTPSPSPSPAATLTLTATTRPSATSTANEEIEKLRSEKAALQSQLDAANQNLTDLRNGVKTANAYNDFLEYLTQVIDAHDGFNGWTDAEYQVGREKAQATGNQSFIDTVDTAWNNHAIDVTTRVINVYRGIVSGTKDALN